MWEESLVSESEDNEQVLLPIAALLPPNQITSKTYTPDVKPSFKLIIEKQKREKKRTTIQSVVCYSEHFRECDTLGREYSEKMLSKLVYMKLNNANYMQFTIRNRSLKYLAGMFIPCDLLLKEDVKRTRNVFKTLSGISYIDWKSDPAHSFAENSYTDAPELKFSSNYQSGNLFAVFRSSDSEYDLVLQNDTNSKGNTQWFHFTVQLYEAKNYKFNIVNLTKSTSLYQKGMGVVLHSQKEERKGWVRGGHSIRYGQSHISREDDKSAFYYRLHFEYESIYARDVVTFAYCYPYSFVDMEMYFHRLMFKRLAHALRIEKVKIGETLSGNPLYAFSIKCKKTAKRPSLSPDYKCDRPSALLPVSSLHSVVFLARQHPGESQSSYVLQGIVDFLMESNDYDSYKRNFSFYVVPLVNIDGVYYGNYRANLSGNDLNRVWRSPRREFHSEVIAIKKSLLALNLSAPISLIVDIHGHSASLNSFFYGNPTRKDTSPAHSENKSLFPYFCSKKMKQVSFSQCSFTISDSKKDCARVVLSEMFPKALVYTFQNSFFGWKKGKRIVEYTADGFRKLGRNLMQTYLEYSRLLEKNSSLKEVWAKQIEELQTRTEHSDEVFSESDREIDDQLTDLLPVEVLDNNEFSSDQILTQPERFNRIQAQNLSVRRSTCGRNRFIKHIRRSPQTSEQLSSKEQLKNSEGSNQQNGFLSIVKINSRAFSPETNLIQPPRQSLKSGGAPSEKQWKNKYFKPRMSLKEMKQEGFKENYETFVKVSSLITEKQIALQKLRMKRMRMEESFNPKNYHRFLRSANCLKVAEQ